LIDWFIDRYRWRWCLWWIRSLLAARHVLCQHISLLLSVQCFDLDVWYRHAVVPPALCCSTGPSTVRRAHSRPEAADDHASAGRGHAAVRRRPRRRLILPRRFVTGRSSPPKFASALPAWRRRGADRRYRPPRPSPELWPCGLSGATWRRRGFPGRKTVAWRRKIPTSSCKLCRPQLRQFRRRSFKLFAIVYFSVQ